MARKLKKKLKKLADQVIVITGASSGIGLATARMAAERGARVVLFGRSGDALARAVEQILANGGDAIAVTGDVTREADLETLAARAVESFGGIDAWVNNAGVSAYGPLGDVPLEDARRLFETNFWGLVLGTRIALRHLRDTGGAIVNLGSEVSERAIPLQGFYSASKHAIKGYTEALRAEIEAERLPVSVTLIKPGPIDTPYTMNAKNFLASEPRHAPPPVYAPEVVARAILRACAHPTRDLYVGGAARMAGAFGHLFPSLADKLLARTVVPGTPSGAQPRRPRDRSGLDVATEQLATRGNYAGPVRNVSLYTEAASRPLATALSLAGTGLALALAWRAIPHRRAVIRGGKGPRRIAKGLHITLRSRRGREGELMDLIGEIRRHVADEPGTLPWFGLRRNRRVFEIFESFPDERARRAHLSGQGARALLDRSRELLAKPARITRLDVVDLKQEP